MIRSFDQLDQLRLGGDRGAGRDDRVNRGFRSEQRLDRGKAVVAAARKFEPDDPARRKKRHRCCFSGEQRGILRQLRSRQVESLGILAGKADQAARNGFHRRLVGAGEEGEADRGVEARLAFEVGGLDALHCPGADTGGASTAPGWPPPRFA